MSLDIPEISLRLDQSDLPLRWLMFNDNRFTCCQFNDSSSEFRNSSCCIIHQSSVQSLEETDERISQVNIRSKWRVRDRDIHFGMRMCTLHFLPFTWTLHLHTTTTFFPGAIKGPLCSAPWLIANWPLNIIAAHKSEAASHFRFPFFPFPCSFYY